MKKLLKVICITMCLALLFVGCSNGGGSLIKSKYDFDGTPYTLFTQQERRIWYYELDENNLHGEIRYSTKPDKIIIVENGSPVIYNNDGDKTYGVFAEMSDDEIVEYCKNECECVLMAVDAVYEKLEEEYNTYNIGDIVEGEKNIHGDTVSYVLADKENLPEEKLPTVKFFVRRDATGNETVFEHVDFPKYVYEYECAYDHSADLDKAHGRFKEYTNFNFDIQSWSDEPQIIKSAKFAVFYCEHLKENVYLSTKINGEFRFSFDEPDTDFGIYNGSNS